MSQTGKHRYSSGDSITYQNGKKGFTVRNYLASGAFGEVHEVFSEVQHKYRAMKCTRFDSMSPEARRANFRPMCEEALLMIDLQHHPNIISLRFVKISGSEFLVIMDLVTDTKELSVAFSTNILWQAPLDQIQNSNDWRSSKNVSSILSVLWYQLSSALDHLHSKKIMHCDVKPDNVMVNSSTCHMYLMDMGLACRLHAMVYACGL